jgi:hypothetical protein
MKIKNRLLSTVCAVLLLTQGAFSAEEIIEPTGLAQILDVLDSDEKLQKRLLPENIAIAKSSAVEMNKLIKEAIIARGLANDGDISKADAREINDYLVQNYKRRWYQLRGVKNDEKSSGYGWAESKCSETLALNTNAVRLWGNIYNLGFRAYDKNRLTNYNGDKSTSFDSAGYYLHEVMKEDVASGALYNRDYVEVNGTTGTGLDSIIDVILRDEGLIRRVSTGDMREGARTADAMNHLIIEAIIEEGLGNDATITPADTRQINNYLVKHHKKEWMTLHGDDEDNEETGYHLVQNDGAYARMYADNVINTVADGLYHLGFETDNKYRLKNEDRNNNASFEKVAWWLDTTLRSDLDAGKLDNPDYQEVIGTTGTSFDYIVLYIYNEPGLVLKTSMEDIRVGAQSANAMNELIVEAIKNTGVASDDYISSDEVKMLNEYLTTNYQGEWIKLHGDDEEYEETGYHRIQNDGALGYMYNRNVINSLADSVYHLGFATTYEKNLVNEDGKKNASFKSVAYWLNKFLQDDYAQGLLR